jgi:sterol desaturase/sphingolipid hydroxylase (fatty acid hydroxylase superfamily)
LLPAASHIAASIHRVHHSDGDFDLSTGVRNHPGEVFVGLAAYLAAVALLAPQAAPK